MAEPNYLPWPHSPKSSPPVTGRRDAGYKLVRSLGTQGVSLFDHAHRVVRSIATLPGRDISIFRPPFPQARLLVPQQRRGQVLDHRREPVLISTVTPMPGASSTRRSSTDHLFLQARRPLLGLREIGEAGALVLRIQPAQ